MGRLEIEIYDHQKKIEFREELIERWLELARQAVDPILEIALENDRSVLKSLSELEFSLVDDETIAQVHGDFMNIPTPTDVITFDHGEAHIGVETAVRQAEEYSELFEREVGRYMIHALLHLAGYTDDTSEAREQMTTHQERILKDLWS